MTYCNIAFVDDLCLHIMIKTLIIVGIFLYSEMHDYA